eukprot:CAMPEP_0201103640 /NCGR_PEP_ID=MMETSP0812-20130820/31185_1 /ASSEMBLY_ACC=CAM_ASM_000668 /TAXON_ID=98059 /ORGANISM="Dinobryon sp., Strain UTEXLB2267" /LENGTH=177 /DNA_ID=CAMNT_0047362135 /DNA_START=326 /DNA_END=859 /DNA_ORIENTATION=+
MEGEFVANKVGDVVVGRAEGVLVGLFDGAVGFIEGRTVGREGLTVVRMEGEFVGVLVILNVGVLVGGFVVGSAVGKNVLVGSLKIKIGTMVTTPNAAATPAVILTGPEPTEGSFNLAMYVCESIPRKVWTRLMVDAATRVTLARQLLPLTNTAEPLPSIKTSRENGEIETSNTSPLM